jgi:molybdopterin/thiamine biosynthesis adenylyltransferase
LKQFLPPLVTPSDEEPIAAGGRQITLADELRLRDRILNKQHFAAARDAVG